MEYSESHKMAEYSCYSDATAVRKCCYCVSAGMQRRLCPCTPLLSGRGLVPVGGGGGGGGGSHIQGGKAADTTDGRAHTMATAGSTHLVYPPSNNDDISSVLQHSLERSITFTPHTSGVQGGATLECRNANLFWCQVLLTERVPAPF